MIATLHHLPFAEALSKAARLLGPAASCSLLGSCSAVAGRRRRAPSSGIPSAATTASRGGR
jgi:hypothetical protein